MPSGQSSGRPSTFFGVKIFDGRFDHVSSFVCAGSCTSRQDLSLYFSIAKRVRPEHTPSITGPENRVSTSSGHGRPPGEPPHHAEDEEYGQANRFAFDIGSRVACGRSRAPFRQLLGLVARPEFR
jgi:hypothetical protein